MLNILIPYIHSLTSPFFLNAEAERRERATKNLDFWDKKIRLFLLEQKVSQMAFLYASYLK